MASATLTRRAPSTAGITAPGDKRFRRPDVRPSGSRGLFWWCRRLSRPVIAVAAVTAIGYAAVRGVVSSRLFVVSHVIVKGNNHLSAGEAEALLQGARGQAILGLDLDTLRRRLMDSPWVADAVVRRVLPATIEVRILERVPMAIARVQGRLYLVDEAGVIMDEFGPEYREFDLPLVDGLAGAAPAGSTALDEERAALVQRFLQSLKTAGPIRQRISQVDVSNDRDVAVLLGDSPTLVHLGDGKFLERLTRFDELLPTLQERLSQIDYVDMRFDERVYVKSKGHPGLTPARR